MRERSEPTLELKVTLLDTDPVVWREIWLPATFNFYQLHLAIQAAFGWEISHLFQFGKNGIADDEDGVGIPDDESPVKDARKIKVKKLLARPADQLLYVYDFGDHWEHRIEVQAISKKDFGIAVCVDGAGECPPEDVGGTSGYQEMLRVMKSRENEEKKSYRTWLGLAPGKKWDPNYYNQREVNKRMALLSPEEFTFG